MQKIIWDNITGKQDVVLLADGVTEPEVASATEHVGAVDTAVVETLPNGTAVATIRDSPNITVGTAETSVGMLSYVLILQNLPRSFLELRLLLESVPESVESVMAAWEEVAPPSPTEISIAAPTLRRSLLQQEESPAPATWNSETALTSIDADRKKSESTISGQEHAPAVKKTRKLQQGNTTTASSSAAPVFGIVAATAAAIATCGNGVCEFGEAVGTWAYTPAWHCPQDCPFELHTCPQQVCPVAQKFLIYEQATSMKSKP